jgi:5-methylcytosine-specific restriction endonuclease McrA
MAKRAWNVKSAVIAWLRRLSYRTPMRSQAMRNAKVAYGRYRCNACDQIFPPTTVQVDHISPVIPVSGWTTWDDYINRLFCPPEQLQVLCKPCHSVKSGLENQGRKRRGKTSNP